MCMFMTLYITATAIISVWIQNASTYYQFLFVINLMIVTQIDLWLCILFNDCRLLLASFARTAAECPAVYFVGVMDQVRLWSYERPPSLVYSQGILIYIYIYLCIFIHKVVFRMIGAAYLSLTQFLGRCLGAHRQTDSHIVYVIYMYIYTYSLSYTAHVYVCTRVYVCMFVCIYT